MSRPRSITQGQTEAVIRLYRAQKLTVKQIMAQTGVRSEQTIYRILSANNVPKLKMRKPTRRISVGLDEEAERIIREARPRNISEFVSEMIKRGYGKR